ncbi:MAG: hypothetical protein K6E41_03555 [Solobacterium sp.]|nr:hypothetical protein [Solobacterium sp.]
MNNYRIIAIGDNVCDKYLSRGKMYPGGQCVNTCAYTRMNGGDAAYLGKFGTDGAADHIKHVLNELSIDYSHSRTYEGENGFALVTMNGSDRVFLGSNRGGIAKEHPFAFNEEDFEYIKGFSIIYTNLSSYIENDIRILAETGVPVAFDFSDRRDPEYVEMIAPYVKVALLSCADLDDREREQWMRCVHEAGAETVVGTVGENGSYVLYDDEYLYAPAMRAENIIDTMGAGDSYFAAFLYHLMSSSAGRQLVEEDSSRMRDRIHDAMVKAADFAAHVCELEGAFGFGTEITGRTSL